MIQQYIMSKYLMVDKKFALLMLKKVGLFISIVGLIAARAEHSAIPSEDLEEFDHESSVIGQFLQKNLRVTAGTYSGNIGTFDIFSVGHKHHWWGQLGGAGGPYLLGMGSGYRYLFKNTNPHQEYFLGGYALVGMHAVKGCAPHTQEAKEVVSSKAWYDWLGVGCVGGEWGTNQWQWTLQHGWGKILQGTEADYHHITQSTSLRLSSYYMQKFYLLGRVNIFGFGSRHNVLNTLDQEENTLYTGGLGMRWEHRYFTAEPRLIWGENRKTSSWLPQLYIGMQVHFGEHRDPKSMHSVKSRLSEAPQSYYPNHYALNPGADVEVPDPYQRRDVPLKENSAFSVFER